MVGQGSNHVNAALTVENWSWPCSLCAEVMVVNHYYTQNWGLTMCFLRQCFLCAPKLAPSWHAALLCRSHVDCGKCYCFLRHNNCSVLAMQPLCRSLRHWGLTMCILRQCCTHCLCPTLWWPCSLCAEVRMFLCRRQCCGKSLLHTKLGFVPMLHSHLCPTLWSMLQNWLGLGHAAFVQKS